VTSAERVGLVVREQRFGELIAFALITALGGFLVATAGGYTVFREDGTVGGGFLPLLVGLVLLGLGAVQLVASAVRVRALASNVPQLQSRARERAADDAVPDVFGRTARQRVHQLGLVVVATVVAVALTPLLGLLVALTLLSIFISAVVERRSLVASVAISVASVGLVYVIFVPLLGIPLPWGMLFGAGF